MRPNTTSDESVNTDLIQMDANDQLDLSAFDGNSNEPPGLQQLRLMEQDLFKGHAGEILARSNGTLADLDDDSVADFDI